MLQDINGTFQQGKTNLIIGASGSGKSVLLKNTVGLFKPDAGEILYNGRSFVDADRDKKFRSDVRLGCFFKAERSSTL